MYAHTRRPNVRLRIDAAGQDAEVYNIDILARDRGLWTLAAIVHLTEAGSRTTPYALALCQRNDVALVIREIESISSKEHRS